MPKKVRIQNAISSPRPISRKNAEKYVSQGRAEWTSDKRNCIVFIETDYRHVSAMRDYYDPAGAVVKHAPKLPGTTQYNYSYSWLCDQAAVIRHWASQQTPGVEARTA